MMRIEVTERGVFIQAGERVSAWDGETYQATDFEPGRAWVITLDDEGRFQSALAEDGETAASVDDWERKAGIRWLGVVR